MKDKDIIGKTFIAFKFDNVKPVAYSSQHKESFGKKAKVLHLHDSLPYAYCSIKISSTTEILNYYPIAMIKEQFESMEKEKNQSIGDLIIEMKQLISKI